MKKYILFSILTAFILFESCKLNKDFALSGAKKSWSHHFAFGSPSWDAFERFPNNPVYKGRDGMEWPVNGFLFSDPVSKNWYLYIGEYRRNYAMTSDSTTKNFNCAIYKSTDRGKNWEKTGDLFPLNLICYDSLHIQAPDVMVVFDKGKYHLIFDWVSTKASWKEMGESGIGYAVADKPEGPFMVSQKPLKINTQYRDQPLLNKYWRMYAPMLVKRQNDWVMLYMMDTAPPRSWALVASTSPKPEGPYTDPVVIKNVEGKSDYPPLMEYFPAFTHDGYAYFPATSVAANRNYQLISRVKIENVTNPHQWEVFSAGSFWHSTNSPNEYSGIWGQTITGFVDDSDTLVVMYPSKNKANFGTVNLAKASWNHLFNSPGFKLSACEGSSFTYLKKGIDLNELAVDFNLTGTMQLLWDFHKPLDIKDTWGNFSFDHQPGEYRAIEISRTSWKIKTIQDDKVLTLDSGLIHNYNEVLNRLQFKKQKGTYSLAINGQECWKGSLDANPGVIGIKLNPRSNLEVSKFEVKGKAAKGKLIYGYYEALLNSGNQDADWEFIKGPAFKNGQGAISKRASAFAKWNFEGTRFELFSPKGPLFGTVSVYIDSLLAGHVLLKKEQPENSSVVFKSKFLGLGSHSIYLESYDGRLPLDCIEVCF
ncbi:MAG: hypothetical protein WCL21_00010 [Mariniphaga sp.]